MSEKKESVKDNSIWTDIMIPKSLSGREEFNIVKGKVDTFSKELESYFPAGRVSIAISEEKDKFFPFEKVISNIIKSKAIYNEYSFMRDPSLAKEFSEVMEHIKEINKIIDKRRKSNPRRK